tara:strand:- start:1400 stop:1816 length:417 start_codon:yes stop_codon:yes gene_type:complete
MIQINIAETLTMFFQIGLVAGLFFLVGVILHTRAKVLSIKKELDLSRLESAMLLSEIDKLVDEASVLKMESSDGFVKFLSDSRDWAFGFIDDVQETIRSMQIGMASMDSQKVLEEFNKLLKYLPEDKIRNEKQGDANE